MDPPHVVYMGQYDPEYDRNAIIRQGLEAQDIRITECRIGKEYMRWGQYAAMLRLCRRVSRPDAVILAEFNPFLAPLARLLAWYWQTRFIFDPLVSRYETTVCDRQIVSPHSWRAHRLWLQDWLAFHLAYALLADTHQHRLYYAQAFGLRKEKTFVVPVGARTDVFYPRPRSDEEGFQVLFWGTYIPLQGVKWIVRAAHLLRHERRIRWMFIGSGQTYQDIRRESEWLALSHVRFVDQRIPRDALAQAIARADITLGVFGQTPKAQRVVPNKVYQGLAMAKPVITGDSPAVREFFTPGEHLHTVPMADPEALAQAILCLVRDEEYRCHLAQQGYEHFQAHFTPKHIGRRVKDVLEQLV